MLQLKKAAPLEASVLLAPDPQGIESLFTVVKATFTLAGGVVLAEKQLPVTMSDKYRAEPGRSSLLAASDVSLVKPGTDVLLQGKAYAPGGAAVPQMDVSICVGQVAKTIRVFGDRFWKKGLLGGRPSPAAPFSVMPLEWERAFGGTELTGESPPRVYAENRNPAGVGFRARPGKDESDASKLPNLEDPARLIRSIKDCPPPAGLGPLPASWEPRRSHAGTYDQTWQQKRAPYLPTDFDSRFFQLAPPGMVHPQYLMGGETVEVHGATPAGLLRFNLPRYRIEVVHTLDGAKHSRPANLDTVLIEPDEDRLVVLWRAAFPCDKKTLRVEEIRVNWKMEA